jgi:hypothetical protein
MRDDQVGTNPVAKRTSRAWYIMFKVLTFVFGLMFLVDLPVVADALTKTNGNLANAAGAMLGWFLIGLLFFACMLRLFIIQKIQSRSRLEQMRQLSRK